MQKSGCIHVFRDSAPVQARITKPNCPKELALMVFNPLKRTPRLLAISRDRLDLQRFMKEENGFANLLQGKDGEIESNMVTARSGTNCSQTRVSAPRS